MSRPRLTLMHMTGPEVSRVIAWGIVCAMVYVLAIVAACFMVVAWLIRW